MADKQIQGHLCGVHRGALDRRCAELLVSFFDNIQPWEMLKRFFSLFHRMLGFFFFFFSAPFSFGGFTEEYVPRLPIIQLGYLLSESLNHCYVVLS